MHLFFRLLVSFCTLSLLIFAYVFLHYSSSLPNYETLKNYQPVQITRIYSADFKLIEEYGMQKRVFVPISSIPSLVKNAFIAAEDKNFYHHNGIDFTSTIQAALYAIPRIYSKRTLKGGSTITQQVVKNLLLSSERTVDRKIKELILATVISKKLSKDQILELYLNQIYFGLGVYGIATASKSYFDKSVEHLSIAEVAFLSGLLSSPLNCDPRTNYKRAKTRRNYALCRMYENKFITAQEMKDALTSEILMKKRASVGLQAPHYAQKVRELAIQKVGSQLFYSGGLTIVTTLNSQYQEDAYKALSQGLYKYDSANVYKGSLGQIDIASWKENLNKFGTRLNLHKGIEMAVITSIDEALGLYTIGLGSGDIVLLANKGSFQNVLKPAYKKKTLRIGDVIIVCKEHGQYQLTQMPECDGAIFAMQPHSGKVLAMVGGYNYEASKFDRATQAKRQIGSLVKTFVYLAALENNLEPNTIFVDEPIEISQGSHLPSWTPKNFSGKFLGPMTMRTAFESSCNTVTVKIGEVLGIGTISKLLSRLGIAVGDKQYLSIVLGAIESTLSQVVSAYAAVINGGYAVKPIFIEYIQDSKGRVIYSNSLCMKDAFAESNDPPVFLQKTGPRVIDEASAYQLTSMMVGAAKRGTARGFGNRFKHVVGGKTGTTSENRDVWFIGFANDLVVGSYVGHDLPQSLGQHAFGATVALPIVASFMDQALQSKPVVQFRIPKNIRLQVVDINTGVATHRSENTLVEAFKINPEAGIAPTEALNIDEKTSVPEIKEKFDDTEESDLEMMDEEMFNLEDQ
jgi:penicillin-binding protein 1A